VYEITRVLSKSIFVVPMVLGSLLGNAQSERIDSLKTLVVRSSGVQRFDRSIELMQELFRYEKYNEALQVCREAYQVAYDLGDSAKIVRCGRSAGILLNRLDRSSEAAGELQKVLPIARRNNL